MAEQTVFRPVLPGENIDAIAVALTGAFSAIRAGLEGGSSVAVVLRAADLEGQGTPADAAVATGILGMVRTLAIEGAKPGWRVNVVAAGGDDADVDGVLAALADAPLSGQLLQTGGANLGKVVA
jgi:NAD(P)-dependent dehydrogenase (short-subunit alcohol dehydrogenase family)